MSKELRLSAAEIRENSLDIHALALRQFCGGVSNDLAHGKRVIISADPYKPGLVHPVQIIEPGSRKL